MSDIPNSKNNIKEKKEMAINRDRDNNTRQRTRTVFVPVNVGGGGGGGTQEKIKVGETGLRFQETHFTEIPEIFDFSDVTNFSYMFTNCYSLTSIPKIDYSKITNYQNAFVRTKVEDFSKVNTINATTLEGIFYGCSTITESPVIDCSHATNLFRLFWQCANLTDAHVINTGLAQRMDCMFESCGKLTGITETISLSSCTNANSMFAGCSSLKRIPNLINTTKLTSITNIFGGCHSLITIPEMDWSNVTSVWVWAEFNSCSSLTDVGGFIGLKVEINMSSCPLTHDSIMNIINKAADVTENPKTMTFGETNLAKLSDEEKAIATAKGWTLA